MAAIFTRIAREDRDRARAFVTSIEERCLSLLLLPRQGRAREDILPGLRILPFRRRVVIAYRVAEVEIEILRVFYGGRDYENALREALDR